MREAGAKGWALFAITLITACGRIGFDDVLGPFGAPQRVIELDDPAANDDDPTLTADQLEIYFNSARGGPSEVWWAHRTTTSDPWSAPELVAGLSDGSYKSAPEITGDGLTIYYSSNRPGGAGLMDLWVATRSSRQSAWSTAVPVTDVNSSANDLGGVLAANGTVMEIHSDRPDTSQYDLYFATRTGATWGTPTAIPGLNTPGIEGNVFPSEDLLSVYFDSNRPGGVGGEDIYVATRTDPTAAFDTPTLVTELCTSADDEDVWLSPDRHTVYFTQRDSNGFQAIFRAER